ncbi:Circadian clock protein kinase KaiC [uncultured archaeon]|nr:Circadian clock protein kinase KaiC [uncultured archaeon]
MVIVEKDKVKTTISDLLKSHPEGLSIVDIMKMTGLARHTVLARLHGLIGANHVGVRKVNMAKLHSWKAGEEEVVEQGDKAKIVSLEEKHIKKKSDKKVEVSKQKEFDATKVKQEVEEKLRGGKIKKSEAEIFEKRAPLVHVLEGSKEKTGKLGKDYVKTGIKGFDDLLEQGIPSGSSVLVAGGAGSGKTIFCLQTLINKAREGKKCFYMSFEENEERLIEHMEGFGWNPRELIKKGKLRLQRMNPFDITRNVDALLAQQKGELLIDVDPVIMPEDFAHPDFVVIDSLTAIASAFTGKEDSYRIYIEQLFRFLEKTGATSFLVTETEQVPKIFSQTGVEEFLADGVIVLYALKHGNVRENAIELLKLRGVSHQKKIVAAQITAEGIVVYPEQEVFSDTG